MSQAHNLSARAATPQSPAARAENQTESRDATPAPGVDEPRNGSSGDDPMTELAKRVAHDVAERIRDDVPPPLKLTNDERLAALERELEELRRRVEIQRRHLISLAESHAYSLDGER